MINPIRILHVVGAMNVGGTETMLMNIYRNIDRNRIQFDFIAYGPEAVFDKEIMRMGGKVIRLSKTRSIKEIYQAIKKYGPYNIVHSHTLFHCGIVNAAAKLAGIRIRISHAHTTLDRSDSFFRKLYIKAMRRVINTFSTDLLACSKEAGRYLFGKQSLNRSNFTYFPNLIDYRHFLTVQDKDVKRFKVSEGIENSVIIGHIGRFIEAKNHRFLLDIFETLVKKDINFKLLLVGDGDLKSLMEEIARKKGIYNNIRFAGMRNDINILLHSMDIFVFPSIYEGLGLALLEAQASGLPCIVSEAIQPEADLNLNLLSRLSLNDGSDDWANRILELAGKKEKCTNKIINGFETNGYSLLQGISKLMKLYNVTLEDA